jgi:hypothetical protein
MDPHSMGSWIQIRIANADPVGEKSAPNKTIKPFLKIFGKMF